MVSGALSAVRPAVVANAPQTPDTIPASARRRGDRRAARVHPGLMVLRSGNELVGTSACGTLWRSRQGLRGGDFDDRHVEIFCAASARVNVRIFYQPLTAPTGLGLLGVTPRRGFSRSGSARLGRSQKDGLPTCRGGYAFRFKAINSRTGEGQPGRCPFLIGRGNGRQINTRPCLAHRLVAPLRNRRLDCGSRCFCLDLFCARGSRHSRRSLEAPALTWTKTISRSSAPQPRARLAGSSRRDGQGGRHCARPVLPGGAMRFAYCALRATR
jgi:hypothetical protein